MPSASPKSLIQYASLVRVATFLLAIALPSHVMAQAQAIFDSSAAAVSVSGVQIRLPAYWLGGPIADWIPRWMCGARSDRPVGERIITDSATLRSAPLSHSIGLFELEDALNAVLPRSALLALASSTAANEACGSVKLLVVRAALDEAAVGAERWATSALRRLQASGVVAKRTHMQRGLWSGEQLQYERDRGDHISVATMEFWTHASGIRPVTLVFTWSSGKDRLYHETERTWILDHVVWP